MSYVKVNFDHNVIINKCFRVYDLKNNRSYIFFMNSSHL